MAGQSVSHRRELTHLPFWDGLLSTNDRSYRKCAARMPPPRSAMLLPGTAISLSHRFGSDSVLSGPEAAEPAATLKNRNTVQYRTSGCLRYPCIHRPEKGLSTIANSRQSPMNTTRDHTSHIFRPQLISACGFPRKPPISDASVPDVWHLV